MAVKSTYGKRLQLVRIEAGLTPLEFAKEVLSKNAKGATISRVESDLKDLSLTVSSKISEKYDVDLDWLVTGKATLKGSDIVRVPQVGERIKAYREFVGISQYELSSTSGLGMNSTNVGRLEAKKHRPRMSTIRKLAKTLHVRPTALAFGMVA